MENPIIQVQQGLLRGVCENNINGTKFYAFRGIPYGKPPVGDLRFKDSEPVEPWSGTRDATQFGNVCAHRDWMAKVFKGHEDSLFLNIYTTDLNPASPRPVMVWIHGGAFVSGSGNDDIYGPDYLVEKDIVLITINYRLGVLGFLNVEDVEAPGNQGLKDQVLALKWIQQNVSRFGGDPNNVTIFGESAGGASVHYLTLSPLAQGLFHKAILQSGVATNPWAYSPHSPIETAKKLAAALGKEIADPKKLVEFLRTIDAERLIEAEYSLRTWQDRFLIINPFGPGVDAKAKNPFLSIPVQEAAKAGVKVPCIFGYLSDEGIIIFENFKEEHYSTLNSENVLIHPNLKKILEEKHITPDDLKKVFIGEGKIEPKDARKLVDLQSAVFFIIGIHQMLEVQARIPHVPTYLFKFEYEKENPMLMQKVLGTDLEGTCHGAELSLLFFPKLFQMFGKGAAEPNSTEHLLIQRFVGLWTSFAKTGKPMTQPAELIPVDWKPINNPMEYDCLKICEDPRMIKETNILQQIQKNIKKNKL